VSVNQTVVIDTRSRPIGKPAVIDTRYTLFSGSVALLLYCFFNPMSQYYEPPMSLSVT
jgi:hypothetical protein